MKTIRIILWALVALFAAGGLALLLADRDDESSATQAQSKALADAIGGNFTLLDRDAKPFEESELRGKPYAIFFGFTRCPDVCPTSLQRMARLRKQLGERGDEFNIVFVSVDSESDTPEDVGRYVDLFGTPIIGLTGSKAQVADAAKKFAIYYKKVPIEGSDGYTVDHSAQIILMDKDGKFRGTITHEESDKVALEKLEKLIG